MFWLVVEAMDCTTPGLEDNKSSDVLVGRRGDGLYHSRPGGE